MTEKKITVAEALSVVTAAITVVNAVAETSNLALQGILGSLLGGIGAFHADNQELDAFLVKAFKSLKECKPLAKYMPVIMDYVMHETGVEAGDYGYKFAAGKNALRKLDKAQAGVKTLSVKDYKSEEKKTELANKKLNRQKTKQEFVDASPKDRVLLLLNTAIADAKTRVEKEEKKGVKGNQTEINKARSERVIIEKLIAFLDQQ